MKLLIEVRGFPPLRQKKIARMGHGAWGSWSPTLRRMREGWGTRQRNEFALVVAASLVLILTGCGHQQTVASWTPPQAVAPPVQAQAQTQEQAYAPLPAPLPPGRIAPTPVPPGGVSEDDLSYVRTHRPLFSEEGLATWYTAPYKGRKAANGEVFSDDDLTAAHRTLPMGSLIVVTNLTTGQSAAMRITDRGPFVADKMIDLTIASAMATGVYHAGTARVRLDVYRTPKSVYTGGRWCVQIGAFTSERKANQFKAQLLRRYPDASVIEFSGEASYWVRIRPQGDNREEAEIIARNLRPAEGDAYLTRLD
jgi:rare lipoprotein A